MKPKRSGVKVPLHSDQQYIFTNPSSGIAIWIALDQANIENGRLEVVPHSHVEFESGPRFEFDSSTGKAKWNYDFITTNSGIATTTTTTTLLRPFPSSSKEQDVLNWVGIDCEPGDAIIFHYGILHRSAPNKSFQSRRALTLHLIDGKCEFPDTNWIPKHEFPRPVGEEVVLLDGTLKIL
jgi:phytanoyl-CoA hydroxylase